jgi:hypothetical protein
MHSIWQVIEEIKSGEGELGEGITRSVKRQRRVAALVTTAAVVLISALAFVYINRKDGSTSTPVPAPPDSTRVTIRTDPPGASVILGQRMLGTSPIENEPVRAGLAPLSIRLDGYKVIVDTLDLQKDEPWEKSYDLIEKTGHLSLTTSPEGAWIYLNNKRQSRRTPCIIRDLPVKDFYNIRLTLRDYQDGAFTSVRVVEDKETKIHHDFSISKQQVGITSTPDSADIYLNDQLVGKTPTSRPIPYGTHRLMIRKYGYETYGRNIRVPVEGGGITAVLTELPPGTLIIEVTPWARIEVDGIFQKEGSRCVATLRQGKHRVVLRNQFFNTVEEEVEVISGKRIKKEYKLTEKEDR